MEKMAFVASHYLHTKAGAEAALNLATWYLDRGRYTEAQQTFDVFMLRDPNSAVEADVLLKSAIAFKRAGGKFEKQADKFWEQFGKATSKKDLKLGGRSFTYAQLEAEYAKVIPRFETVGASDVTRPRGGPGNNTQAIGGRRPLLEPRFEFGLNPTTEFDNPAEVKAGKEWIDAKLKSVSTMVESRGQLVIPGFQSVAAGNRILFRTYDGVYSVFSQEDKKADPPIKAGEIDWIYRCKHGLFAQVKEAGGRNLADQWWTNYYANQGGHATLFDNALIGTLSHDGEFAYFVDDMGLPPHLALTNQAMFGGIPNYGQFNDMVYHNRLMAVELETGKRKWELGMPLAASPRRPAGPIGLPGGVPIGPGGGPVPVEDPKDPKDPSDPTAEVKETAQTLFAGAITLGAAAAQRQDLRRPRKGRGAAVGLPRPEEDRHPDDHAGTRLVPAPRRPEGQAPDGRPAAHAERPTRLRRGDHGLPDQRRGRHRRRSAQPLARLGLLVPQREGREPALQAGQGHPVQPAGQQPADRDQQEPLARRRPDHPRTGRSSSPRSTRKTSSAST